MKKTERNSNLEKISLSSNSNIIKVNERLQFIKYLLDETGIKPLLDLSDVSDCTEYFQGGVFKDTFNFIEIINKIGGKLKYIKSGTTGHTFQGIYCLDDKQYNYNSTSSQTNSHNILNYAVKVVGFPINNDEHDLIHCKTRPENAELQILKILSQFVLTNQTPHIILPLTTFNSYIEPFIDLKKKNFISNKKYDAFVEAYEKKKLHNTVSILISEWANGGDLLEYMRINLQNMQLKEWKVLLFQLFSVFAVIQKKYPGFRHNDAKANNILLQRINTLTDSFFKYQVEQIDFFIPNIGYQIKLWDFDFACIAGIAENSKVNSKWTNKINISNRQNRYYDICFFISSLQTPGFIKDFRTNSNVPSQVIDFFDSIVPPELFKSNLINERGRLLCDIEYTTPIEILLTHPFFNKFKLKEDRVPENNFNPSGKLLLHKLISKIIKK